MSEISEWIIKSSAYDQTSGILLTVRLSVVWEIRVWVSKKRKKEKKENRICGNCDALQLDAAWRLACCSWLKYDAKAEVDQPIFSCLITLFTADILLYAVTLTFDPLTFNVCNASAMKW